MVEGTGNNVKQKEEPFGIEHLLIAFGCVALMAFIIHVVVYFLAAIVLMIVLSAVMWWARFFAAAKTTPQDLRREMETAKASGEISQALWTKMFWVMTTMEDGVEKQQLEKTCYDFIREMDPNEYEKMVKDMSKEERETFQLMMSTDPELRRLLGLQSTESQVDMHSESRPYFNSNSTVETITGAGNIISHGLREIR